MDDSIIGQIAYLKQIAAQELKAEKISIMNLQLLANAIQSLETLAYTYSPDQRCYILAIPKDEYHSYMKFQSQQLNKISH